jgi:hypothetical protein
MELIMAILAALAILVSVVALCVSYNAAKKGNILVSSANDLAKTANEMQKNQIELQKGQVEMQIRDMISNARHRYGTTAIHLASNIECQVSIAAERAALEDVCNAYDEACAKYLDNKVDKERFKKLYVDEIRQWVTNKNYIDKYRELDTKFRATVKVFKEWNDLEN